ncbi:MAG: C25 family cysteine peptidase [candidate division WOR-3 bacterium]
MRSFLVFLGLSSFGFGLVFEIPLRDIDYKIEKFQNYDRILLKDGVYLNNPGAPEVPGLVYNYSITPGQKVNKIEIVHEEWEEIPGNFLVCPEQKHFSLNKMPQFTEPNLEIYNSLESYPLTPVISYKSGNLRGYQIFQVLISPFRYQPALKRLFVLKKLTIKVHTIPVNFGIQPLRESSLSSSVFGRFVSSLVRNSVIPTQCEINENPRDQLPTELPSLLGPPVDLVIITREPLIQGYEKIARLRKLFGFNAAIRTLTWVRQHYSGIDDAERIRNFLIDAVEKWGTGFALLGGDVPDIPTRWVWLSLIDPDQWPEHITTDLYFSDLDGNWNFDGDERFGEVEDSIDFYPDIFVGRLTMKDINGVMGYFNKESSYLFPTNLGIQIKWLAVTSDLFYQNDAYDLAQYLSTYLPPWFIKSYLNNASLQAFKDSIYSGFGIIQAIGHGDVNLLRVNPAPEYVTNFFFDSLTNVDRYALLDVISCYTGPFQSDCLGEHFVNNPSGGGIAYIGPTSPSDAYIHTLDFTCALYDSLFSFPISMALGKSKILFIPQAQYDNWYRFYLYSINLLGDPVVTIWDSIPKVFDAVVVNPETLNLGIDTLTITLTPPVDSFVVIFYKENDVFMKDSGLSGSITTQIKTETPGYLKYSILKGRFRNHIDSLYVSPTIPHLVFDHFTIKDTLHNGNGMVNPGEDIFLLIGLKNNGSANAVGVSAQIFSSDSFITILNNSATYPDISPNAIAENLTPFYFKVKKETPDEHSIDFSISITYNGTNSDSFQIIAFSPNLRLFTQHCDSSTGNYLISPVVENSGHCRAESVICKIYSLSDTITVIDSVAYFPDILPGGIASALDSLGLLLNYPGDIEYNFRLYYRGLEIANQRISLQTPPRPDSFKAIGSFNSIILQWKPVDGAIGYRIYRATNPAGNYEFLRNSLERISTFEDYNVQTGIDYYYYLFAVDSFMNQGLCTETLSARPNPAIAPGWPRVLYAHPYCSCNFGELDPSYPGLEIVAATRNDGAVYAWHYDGTPVAQSPYGDGRIFVANGEMWTSPAIGDLNNDGIMDLVFGVRRTTNNLYAITCYDTIYLPLPGWPITVPGRILSCPVLGDLDEDGDLEIVVRTEWADIYGFKFDGTGYFSPSGLLFDGPGNAVGAPAVGDLNNDGHLEIVSCGGSWSDSLYVWDRFGNYLPPFPVFIQPEYRLRCAVVLGDIIGDSRLEIAFFTDSTHKVYLVSPDGNILWSHEIPYLEMIESYPVFADITGDGRPELICAESKSGNLWVFDSLGNTLSNFPLISSEHDWRRLVCADLNNDNVSDIIVPANNWKVYGYNYKSQSLSGFPIEVGNYINGSPAVYDIDLDGKLELMVAPCDFKFYVFDLNTTKYEWPRFRYDQYNSGVYKSKNLPGIEIISQFPLLTSHFQLQVYPNPFQNHCVIKFQIPNPKFQTNSKSQIPNKNLSTRYSLLATLCIYDATGRLVRDFPRLTTYDGRSTEIIWDGTDDLGRRLPAGVYFIRLECGKNSKVAKAVLLK